MFMVGLVMLKVKPDELTLPMTALMMPQELMSEEQTVMAEEPLVLVVLKVTALPLKLA